MTAHFQFFLHVIEFYVNMTEGWTSTYWDFESACYVQRYLARVIMPWRKISQHSLHETSLLPYMLWELYSSKTRTNGDTMIFLLACQTGLQVEKASGA